MESSAQKVQVWIYSRDPKSLRFYFLLLLTKPERGAHWQPVTGHVDLGESLENAALREAREETGLNFAGLPCPIGDPFQFESRGRKVIEYGFSLQVENSTGPLPAVRLDPHEHTQFQWVDQTKVFELLPFPAQAEVLTALLKVFQSKTGSLF